jgi:hypothetical protein
MFAVYALDLVNGQSDVPELVQVLFETPFSGDQSTERQVDDLDVELFTHIIQQIFPSMKLLPISQLLERKGTPEALEAVATWRGQQGEGER